MDSVALSQSSEEQSHYHVDEQLQPDERSPFSDYSSFLAERVSTKSIPFFNILLGPIINMQLGHVVEGVVDYVIRKSPCRDLP